MALMNGTIAGLAGITPASGFIDSQASLGLGAVIGLCTFWTVGMFKHKLGIDDALDVSSVHGVSGIVGSIGVGFLATQQLTPRSITSMSVVCSTVEDYICCVPRSSVSQQRSSGQLR